MLSGRKKNKKNKKKPTEEKDWNGTSPARLRESPSGVQQDPPAPSPRAPTLMPSKMRSSSAVELGSTGLGRGAALGKRPSLGGVPSLSVQRQQGAPTRVAEPKLHPSPHPQVTAFNGQVKTASRTRDRPPYRYPQTIAYTQSPSSVARTEGFFVPEQLRQELQHRQAMCLAMPLEGVCPTEVEHYHSLCMLDNPTPPEISSIQGQVSTCYRATSSRDSLYYCMRRIHGPPSVPHPMHHRVGRRSSFGRKKGGLLVITDKTLTFQLGAVHGTVADFLEGLLVLKPVEGYKLSSKGALQTLEKWKKLQHSNLVSLKEMFTTKAFRDNSVVLVYDFHPGADTLANHLVASRDSTSGLLPEDTLWDYIIQLVSGLRVVHGLGLAISCINLTKVLVTSSSRHRRRVRMNCCGMMGILSSDQSDSDTIHVEQQKDLICLGHLILSLALMSPVAAHADNFVNSVDMIKANYSIDIQNLVQYLCNVAKPPCSISDVTSMVGEYTYTSLDRAQFHQDLLEEELSKEVENGRLFRLLAKLGTINERPEYAGDAAWSETGDRYLLKLLRDYLFHQVLPTGRPWIDLAHIVQTLNKLDAGSLENIALHSRDEQSLLVVSYADLKGCIEASFGELLSTSENH